MNETDCIERWKGKRFAVRKGIAALSESSAVAIATVIDISKREISILYIPTEELKGTSLNIDNLPTDHNFYISGIPVTTISNFKLENKIPFSYIYERRCCMQFGELTAN